MSIPVPLLLLTSLVLSACQGHPATPGPPIALLEESIKMVDDVLKAKVSCDEVNVTNVFVDSKADDDAELLCQVTGVTCDTRSCHKFLEGLCINLLRLVQKKGGVHTRPCPLGTSSTTSLNQFLEDLQRVLRRLLKNQTLK